MSQNNTLTCFISPACAGGAVRLVAQIRRNPARGRRRAVRRSCRKICFPEGWRRRRTGRRHRAAPRIVRRTACRRDSRRGTESISCRASKVRRDAASTGELSIVDARRDWQVSQALAARSVPGNVPARFSTGSGNPTQCEAAHIAAQQAVISPLRQSRSVTQETVVTTRIPTLLRWTEEAEAAQVRALAAFECEPESAAVRPVAFAPQPLSHAHPSGGAASAVELVRWFGSANRARRRLTQTIYDDLRLG